MKSTARMFRPAPRSAVTSAVRRAPDPSRAAAMYQPRVCLIKLALPQRTTSVSPNASQAKRYLACVIWWLVTAAVSMLQEIWTTDGSFKVGDAAHPPAMTNPKCPSERRKPKYNGTSRAVWCTTANGFAVCCCRQSRHGAQDLRHVCQTVS